MSGEVMNFEQAVAQLARMLGDQYSRMHGADAGPVLELSVIAKLEDGSFLVGGGGDEDGPASELHTVARELRERELGPVVDIWIGTETQAEDDDARE